MSLTFNTFWENSADDKLMIFSDFSQKISNNLHEMTKPISLKQKYENISNCHLLKFLAKKYERFSFISP